jgi:hypothetical protein
MSLSAPIHVLKRRAKLRARKGDIPLHEALDRIARAEGFRSWSLLAAKNPTPIAPPTKNTTNPRSNGKPQITSLPLSSEDRSAFIETANEVFENVIERIEPDHPEATRAMWNAEDYVDSFLQDDMLPIDRDYALSLIDAFLVHHVIGLAVDADKQAETERA